MTTFLAAAASSAPPAGGAAIGQVVGASVAAAILTSLLVVLGFGHRSGRVTILGDVAGFAARISGLPRWAALPSGFAAGSLIVAAFGFYWDVAIHIDNGRDPGPLANPAHYFILAGLFGIATAGWFAVVLPEGRPGPAAIRITRDWHAPVGGILLIACAFFALVGFPLDDVSHRLFGQDVTLWGPTHLMMLGGAAMTLVAILVLLSEARLAARAGDGNPDGAPGPVAFLTPARMRALRQVSAFGGLLIGLSIFQGEFDFGVPQFRLLYEPLLIAFAAALTMVSARAVAGRGAALGAVAFFFLVRGLLALWVGPLTGHTATHLPLYVVEALVVEAAALAASPSRRPYRYGVLSGVLVGVFGTLSESAWSQIAMPIPWPAHALGGALLVGLIGGVTGGLVGTFVAGGLRLRAEVVGAPRHWATAVGALLVLAVTIGALGHTTVPKGRALVTLTPAASHDGQRYANATVRFTPAAVADKADWLDGMAWQGDGKRVLAPLRRVAEGVYRTTAALPVSGDWKSSIRLHRGTVMASVPVYLPADAAIPTPEIAAPPRFVRPLQSERSILQRERKHDVPGWLWGVAGLIVLAFVVAILGFTGWCLVRITRLGAPLRAGDGSDSEASAAGPRVPAVA
ncbi:hypothetical protein NBH00_02535 [Paraconexibacter antarcticus]|uniref:Uncharacterized protein n=1 Tax=Paraconexibacter antarcticus TaxID=2949664 RepID=A0ABY5DTU8_9ACTN|nr:hypothetical protein [Paraconexibacter antarcticus]UTI65096.1 hypothetical protein NBH00_02535 [Paraconexibacter antarcticus]